MALIATTDIKTELGIAVADTDNDTIFTAMIAGVESIWNELTNRQWESSTLTEYHDGGVRSIFVDRPPITALTRIAYGKNELAKIYNTAEESTASVQVTSTGLVLTLDGVSDSTVLFTTYTTITEVVAAVNELGNGWVAEIINDYDDWKSSEILPMYPQNALDSNWVYLCSPLEYLDGYEIDTTRGRIYHPGGFPSGYRNIVVNYTGGYVTSGEGDNVPGWLTKVLVRQCCHWYRQAKDQRWDHSSKSEPAGGGTVAYTRLQDNLLPDFMMLAKYHKKPARYHHD